MGEIQVLPLCFSKLEDYDFLNNCLECCLWVAFTNSIQPGLWLFFSLHSLFIGCLPLANDTSDAKDGSDCKTSVHLQVHLLPCGHCYLHANITGVIPAPRCSQGHAGDELSHSGGNLQRLGDFQAFSACLLQSLLFYRCLCLLNRIFAAVTQIQQH